MRFDDLPEARESFLARYALPPLTFEPAAELPAALRPVWSALSRGAHADACAKAMERLAASPAGAVDERAALYFGLAAGCFGTGNRKRASAAADESITLLPSQWAAHRLVVQMFWSEGDFENAYFYLSTLQSPESRHPWDEPLTEQERHLGIAALAWRLKDWDGVHEHLMRSHDRVDEMPVSLREDAFRVAVYRERAEDAAAMAESLLGDYRIEEIDMMLRTIDSRGWSSHALKLYRKAYQQHKGNELLRRRLVGLCIRQGHVDEARTLTEGNALDMAA